ncbi:DNA polymerase IV [Rubripirellula amarantea]|uniref:DNA polymerase IV n=1 Tax=Rubripirellula amarantea TaxID=2527999 RepID=A0A5C5WYW6_9BACT|nr:DNA polymerase IV [Rubripirellula amarantea]MDA8745849.1 DNA polymerase IV [Rubripirellula amarantea]TWT55105.1 DNA polymerase IV [Rubripirellula amarantea]
MILHIDMDAFYAAIEQRDHPELRGRPVVVGGSSGRGVVAAASYEARRFGIHSAMPGRRALQLCPEVVFVKSRIDHYAAIGKQVREIFLRYTPLVQPLSLDEAFLDVTGSERLFGSAAKIGREIKAAIKIELGLTASVGVAPIKFVAKIASDLQKPDGFVEVGSQSVQSFLDPLPVSRLWGVGRVGQERLHRMGLRTIGDLRVRELDDLKRSFGSWGEHLWKLANGIDERKVVPDRNAKQIGHERTFHEDLTDETMLIAVVSFLSEQVSRRLRRNKRQTRCVSIKYRRDDFRTFARSETLPRATDSTDEIFRVAIALLTEMRSREPRPVRLLGVSLSSLTDRDAPRQMSLFDLAENETSQREVDKVVDGLRDAMGDQAVYRATSHDWIKKKR